GLSGMFARLMKEADIKPKTTAATGKGHAQNSLSFHSLRHAFNSHLADQGVDQELRKSLTGHSSTKVNDAYTHMRLTTLREAVVKLDSV
ncbi:tyrosine-type recombinase/integrase, partial [Akkermansiaceae bacterium]|nr:tyrosine-type recombinase/integrase [Akkermansiaceae bacterium]